MAIKHNKAEFYFGNKWAMDGSTWRVRWNVETGALYAVDVILPWRQVLLGTFETLAEVESVMGEWDQPDCPHYHDLTALMERAHEMEKEIPKCHCGATPEMVDAGKAFYVRCGVCKFRGKPAYLEGLAIRAWKFALRDYAKRSKEIEIDYGFNWSTKFDKKSWRVSWDPGTGMLYAFQAGEPGTPDRIIHLYTAETREQADAAMGDWANPECPYYGNLNALRAHISAPLSYNWDWSEVQFRVRESGDEREWEEIPVKMYSDYWVPESSPQFSAGLVAAWLLNKVLRENKRKGVERSVSVRYNLVGSYQGHYVDFTVTEGSMGIR